MSLLKRRRHFNIIIMLLVKPTMYFYTHVCCLNAQCFSAVAFSAILKFYGKLVKAKCVNDSKTTAVKVKLYHFNIAVSSTLQRL